MSATITIDPRFHGPPDSANGGYAAGRVAELLGGSAEVTLRSPPPLGHPLRVERRADDHVVALDGTEVVVEARRAPLDVEVPPAVAPDVAREAAVRHPIWSHPEQHWFGTCFACGPEREVGDGLRLLPWPADGDVAVADWSPDPSLPATDGRLDPAIVWAALDCTSYWGGVVPASRRGEPPPPYVLGRLTAEVTRRPAPGETLVVMGWHRGEEGRKLFSASAVVDAEGRTLGRGLATWIRVG